MIVYATSNRRHLMPEKASDNLESHLDEDGLLHPAETIEEQLSLSERFGIWLSFYPFSQDEYLDIVKKWLAVLKVDPERAASDDMRFSALQFALERGSRSGRVAQQFARAAASRLALGKGLP